MGVICLGILVLAIPEDRFPVTWIAENGDRLIEEIRDT
jgi:hypothetical protein